MDLIEDDAPGRNEPEFSVSEISGAVKRVIEGEFGRVRVKGEVGRVSRARSGHVYFDLKDDRAVLASVSWKGQAARLTVQPEEGMEVVATGRLTTFPGQSKYQMIVDDIRPAGVGALMAMLEKRRKALAAEGLFDAGRKQELPYLPEVIGVVTSPSGAVIRDILHRLRDRFPRKVLVWPVAVQGERCAPEVTAAIEGFNRLTPGGALPRPDLLIVARGGGSIEDLWGFNEEMVVRAAAASAIPLISAVGHETDTTLIDLAADRRAPTPTAAAEIAVPVRAELLAWVRQSEGRMARAMAERLGRGRERLRDLSRALPRAERLLSDARQRLDAVDRRLDAALVARVQAERVRLARTAAALRPAELARIIGRARERFQGLAARLAPERLARRRAEAGAALERLTRRLDHGAAARVGKARTALDGLALRLDALGPEATLARGYAVVWDGATPVTRKAAAEGRARLQIQFADGRIEVASGGSVPRRKARGGGEDGGPEQGNLF